MAGINGIGNNYGTYQSREAQLSKRAASSTQGSAPHLGTFITNYFDKDGKLIGHTQTPLQCAAKPIPKAVCDDQNKVNYFSNEAGQITNIFDYGNKTEYFDFNNNGTIDSNEKHRHPSA